MEKTYRWIVLIGLLIGLIVNAVATFRLKADVAAMHTSVEQVMTEMKTSVHRLQADAQDFEDGFQKQITEHERLIMDLERMVNFQLDN